VYDIKKFETTCIYQIINFLSIDKNKLQYLSNSILNIDLNKDLKDDFFRKLSKEISLLFENTFYYTITSKLNKIFELTGYNNIYKSELVYSIFIKNILNALYKYPINLITPVKIIHIFWHLIMDSTESYVDVLDSYKIGKYSILQLMKSFFKIKYNIDETTLLTKFKNISQFTYLLYLFGEYIDGNIIVVDNIQNELYKYTTNCSLFNKYLGFLLGSTIKNLILFFDINYTYIDYIKIFNEIKDIDNNDIYIDQNNNLNNDITYILNHFSYNKFSNLHNISKEEFLKMIKDDMDKKLLNITYNHNTTHIFKDILIDYTLVSDSKNKNDEIFKKYNKYFSTQQGFLEYLLRYWTGTSIILDKKYVINFKNLGDAYLAAHTCFYTIDVDFKNIRDIKEIFIIIDDTIIDYISFNAAG